MEVNNNNSSLQTFFSSLPLEIKHKIFILSLLKFIKEETPSVDFLFKNSIKHIKHFTREEDKVILKTYLCFFQSNSTFVFLPDFLPSEISVEEFLVITHVFQKHIEKNVLKNPNNKKLENILGRYLDQYCDESLIKIFLGLIWTSPCPLVDELLIKIEKLFAQRNLVPSVIDTIIKKQQKSLSYTNEIVIELALLNKHEEFSFYLINKMPNESFKEEVLIDIAYKGSLILFRRIFDTSKGNILLEDKNFLNAVVSSGNFEKVKYLIQEKKMPIIDGSILLQRALNSKNLKTISYLIEDQKLLVENQTVILDRLIWDGKLEIFEYFKDKIDFSYDNSIYFKKLLCFNHIDKKLISFFLGLPNIILTWEKTSALVLVMKYRDLSLLKTLLSDPRCDINAYDPFTEAIECDFLDGLKLLLKDSRANPEIFSKSLGRAIFLDNYEAAEILLGDSRTNPNFEIHELDICCDFISCNLSKNRIKILNLLLNDERTQIPQDLLESVLKQSHLSAEVKAILQSLKHSS